MTHKALRSHPVRCRRNVGDNGITPDLERRSELSVDGRPQDKNPQLITNQKKPHKTTNQQPNRFRVNDHKMLTEAQMAHHERPGLPRGDGGCGEHVSHVLTALEIWIRSNHLERYSKSQPFVVV